MIRWTRLGVVALGLGGATLAAPGLARAADAEHGKTVFATNCVSCHGEKGDGKGPVGAALDPPPRDFKNAAFKFDTDQDGKPGTDTDLADVITKGAAAFGGSPLMAPWAHLPEKDVQDLIAHIRVLQQ